MSHRRSISFAITMVLAAGCGSAQPSATSAPAPSASLTTASTAPEPPSPAPEASGSPGPDATIGADAWRDPSNFVAVIDNPWLPFKPGSVWRYTGVKDGERAKDVVTVTSRTEVVNGVTCVVVDDKLWLGGQLEETTLDYYVQDTAGNVWYFGEDTQELDAHGNITSTEGSWRAGVDGGVPGIFMEANPVIGHTFVQEYLEGEAEDHFEVLSLTASVTVPAGSYSGVLLTREWTPLEPDVLDHKFYVHGIGEVREVAVKGPKEELGLVSTSGL